MSLAENIEKFENDKVSIIKEWLQNDDVIYILDSHNIDRELFVKKYAINILEYYISVVKGEKKIGDCPVIQEFLEYLKDKDIKSNELFLICSGFKNSLVNYAFDNDIMSKELNKEINYIFEHNFTGVLNTYTKRIRDIELKLEKTLSIVDKYIIMSETDKDGIITYASQAFCNISGYTKEELIGKKHSIVKHPDTNSVVFEDLWETITEGRTWHGEIKNKKKEEGFYWVDATIEPYFDSDGGIIGYYAIRQDITSKKEVERQQNVLVEQSKSAAMGEMISMIAHQWRQPLQAVSILVQKLPLTKMIEGDISDEVLEQVVDDVGQQLEYMSKTIDDFRDFFRPDKEKEKIELSKLADKAREFLAYMLKVDSIDFKIKGSEDVVISIHINEVVQVLINIIKNARDAMIENQTQNRKLEIRHFIENEFAVIEIEDNAGGIPEKVIKRIFEPYFSTKTNKNGTGLGLYMSKTIIEEHSGGILSVKNENGGAVFKIALPLDKE